MNEQKFYQSNESTCFNNDVAIKYGVDCAIFLQNIRFWILTNKRNGTNFHDGRTWTYNSVDAFVELFPYYTRNTIEYTVKKLVVGTKEYDPVLIVGNYNKAKYDRTKWFAFKNESDWGITTGVDLNKIPKSNSENSEMELGKFRDGIRYIPNTIPDTSTDINTDTYLPPNRPNKDEVSRYSSKKRHNPSSLEVCSLSEETKLISILEQGTGKRIDMLDYVEEWFEWIKIKQSDLFEVKHGSAWVKSYQKYVEQNSKYIQAKKENELCRKYTEAKTQRKKNHNPYNDMMK